MEPNEIIPLDPDEFFAAHEYAAMVAENEFLEELPVLNRNLRFGDQRLYFANVPENRFGFAVMGFFRERKHDKGWSFMRRFFAMMEVMKRIGHVEEVRPYVRNDASGRIEFHKAVFEVAATERLNNRFEFSPETFLRAVRNTAQQMKTAGSEHPSSSAIC